MPDSFAKPAGDSGTGRSLYCPGCNERFPNLNETGVCPRCGARASTHPELSFAETLLLKSGPSPGGDTDTGEPLGIELSGDSCEELDELVGGALAVYDCEALLGRGGMGRVYLARHRDLHRKCALKVLSPKAVAKDIDFVQRFILEGRAAASLNHPNVVTVHAIGQADGYHFLEMEYVPGRSLQSRVDHEGALLPLRATVLAAHVAEGLSAAHRVDIVHRDLKPDNVLLSASGVPKLADFGLAKRIRTEDGVPAERLVGTPNYMAPELFHGEPGSHTSDVYALGVTYFLLLTGRLPFTGNSLEQLMHRVCHEPVPNVRAECPGVTLEMAECLSLLLAKSPRSRPKDAIEAAQLLQAVCGQVQDIESLLQEAFRDQPHVSWSRQGNGYRLELELPDGRGQTLYVEPSEHAAADRLLLIYSLCCEAQPEYYEDALRLNGEMAHGGVAIRNVDGRAMFCVVDTYPRTTVDAEEVRKSALEVALRADGVERLLTGLDHH
jgi:serine/threonine-protein kinase